MALPYSFIGGGTYVNPATIIAQNVPLSDRPDWFFVKDITNWGSTSTAVNPTYAEWFSSMPQGSYLSLGQTVATQPAAANLFSQRGTTGGFTFIDQAFPPIFAPLAATAISNTTFVVSMASTAGLNVGDVVRVINPVGMYEIGGLLFTITALTVNTSITLGYAATAAAAAPGTLYVGPATSATIRKVMLPLFYPREQQVAYISQAMQATVYFFRPHDFTVGEFVDFNIGSAYGMTQLSFLTRYPGMVPAQVLSIVNTATQSSITINVDTTGFSPFVYPGNLINPVPETTPATCFPAGTGPVPGQRPPGSSLLPAFDNRNQYVMNIGLNVVGVASATMQYFGFKADYLNLSNQ